VVRHVRAHHSRFVLPPGEIFAFAKRTAPNQTTYALVSERDPCLEITACRWEGQVLLTDHRFDVLQRQVAREARACGIEAPYSVTLANTTGVFSYPVMAEARKAVA
jgi:hypothetical protein